MGTTTSELVAAALRAYMEERGVTQRDVARFLDRSDSYVSARVLGKYDLSLDIVHAVAVLTGLSPQALVAEIMARMSRS